MSASGPNPDWCDSFLPYQRLNWSQSAGFWSTNHLVVTFSWDMQDKLLLDGWREMVMQDIFGVCAAAKTFSHSCVCSSTALQTRWWIHGLDEICWFLQIFSRIAVQFYSTHSWTPEDAATMHLKWWNQVFIIRPFLVLKCHHIDGSCLLCYCTSATYEGGTVHFVFWPNVSELTCMRKKACWIFARRNLIWQNRPEELLTCLQTADLVLLDEDVKHSSDLYQDYWCHHFHKPNVRKHLMCCHSDKNLINYIML